jgi:hypothetical protein
MTRNRRPVQNNGSRATRNLDPMEQTKEAPKLGLDSERQSRLKIAAVPNALEGPKEQSNQRQIREC